jgi:hypothetical protein
MGVTRRRKAGGCAELSQLNDGIVAPGDDMHERQGDLGKDRVDERVSRSPVGSQMRAIVDLDRGDRIEREGVADHEIDTLAHHAIEGVAPHARISAVGKAGKFGQAHLYEHAIGLPERRIERPEKALLVGAQETTPPIADPARPTQPKREDEDCDEGGQIEKRGRSIPERAETRAPILREGPSDKGELIPHLTPGVPKRREKQVQRLAPCERGADAAVASWTIRSQTSALNGASSFLPISSVTSSIARTIVRESSV